MSNLNSIRILVVEDSPTQAAHIRHLLESYNYKVEVAQNSQQAWDWLSTNIPEMVISDIGMPGEAVKLNAATHIFSPQEITSAIISITKKNRRI